jgi:hypothetical protein
MSTWIHMDVFSPFDCVNEIWPIETLEVTGTQKDHHFENVYTLCTFDANKNFFMLQSLNVHHIKESPMLQVLVFM